jgi:hypothetical protein
VIRPAVTRAAAGALLALVVTACGGSSHGPGSGGAAHGGTALSGLLGIAAGACAGGQPTGSYFRMVTPTGRVGSGPYVSNADSTCRDKTVTLLAPGTDGGLRLGRYQPQPSPAFGAGGNSASAAIVAPAGFFAVKFGVSTNPKDPQSGVSVPAPTASRTGSALTVDVQAWSVAWNHQEFNQGAPKPGSGGARATGTIDPASGAYTLEWSSKIKGGPFNGFTGMWHLTGTLHSA